MSREVQRRKRLRWDAASRGAAQKLSGAEAGFVRAENRTNGTSKASRGRRGPFVLAVRCGTRGERSAKRFAAGPTGSAQQPERGGVRAAAEGL